MHKTFVLLRLHTPFVSSNLNALSIQRFCSTSVSAYGVYVLCLSLEVGEGGGVGGGLCVNSVL